MGQKLSNKRQKPTPQDNLQCTSSSTSDNGHLIGSTLYRASSPGDGNLFNYCSNQDLDTLQRSVTSIPDDLMIEILSRLPVKSLLKFRCVSKSLLALISSPDFIRTHVRKNNENMKHRVICCVHCHEFGGSDLKEFPLKSALNEPVTRATDIDYPKGYHKIGSFKIVGSCNGLVCVTFPKKRSKNGELGILLWNPSMKKYRKLPKFDTKMNSTIWHSWFVACGYGYDESNDDYKVVAMLSVRYRQPEGVTMKEETVTKMYSRKTHTWKEIENLKDGIPINELGYFASGRLHWLTSTTMPRRFHTKHNIHSYALVNETEGDLKIVSLDLESKMFGVVEYPEHEKSNSYCALGIAGGRLCLVRTYESRVMDISVMKEYGVRESWTKVASVNYPEHIVAKLYRQPFGWQNNGGHMLKLEKFLVLYDSEDDSIRFPIIGNFGLVRWVDTYVESLVLPGAFDPVHAVEMQSNRKRFASCLSAC